MKKLLKRIPVVKSWYLKIDNLHERTEWVVNNLSRLLNGSRILDAGCGSQQFRSHCDHLIYSGQDFGQYSTDDKKMIG